MRGNVQEEDSDAEDPNAEPKPPLPNRTGAAADNDEGWTDWKNGEDVRKRFIRKTPGRIIHLGDGSELFTDGGGQFEGEGDEDTSDGEDHGDRRVESSDDDEEEGRGKMVDGVGQEHPGSKEGERHGSPFPPTSPPVPASPRPGQ